MTAAIRRVLGTKKSEFDPRKYLQVAQDAAQKVVVARLEAFGCAGQAPKIKPVELDVMAQRYKKGELTQVVTGGKAAA
jgi:fructose-bisphosphate aldolase class II